MHPFGMEIKKYGHAHCEKDPDGGPQACFFDFDFVVFFVEYAKVEGEHDHNKNHKYNEKEYS